MCKVMIGEYLFPFIKFKSFSHFSLLPSFWHVYLPEQYHKEACIPDRFDNIDNFVNTHGELPIQMYLVHSHYMITK